MKKNLPIIIIIMVVVASLSFYSGMTYAGSKNTRSIAGNFNRIGMNNNRTQGNRQFGANFINGEIISQDNQSITLKLRDGGSKIVLLSASTTVSKMSTGSIADLSNDVNVMVSGTSNSDGSFSAQNIQLSSNFMPTSTPR